MPNFPWTGLLEQWSVEIIGSGEYEDELTPEVTDSGWLGYRGAAEYQRLANDHWFHPKTAAAG